MSNNTSSDTYGEINREEYCGFLCSDITERQQEVVDEIKELRRVNPEFAREFTTRMIKMLVYAMESPD